MDINRDLHIHSSLSPAIHVLEHQWHLHSYLQALTEINDHKGKLQSIQELSTHLLYLEPIFDGKPISDDLRTLSNHFQNLVMEVFSLLEAQVKIIRCTLIMGLNIIISKDLWVFLGGGGCERVEGPLKVGFPCDISHIIIMWLPPHFASRKFIIVCIFARDFCTGKAKGGSAFAWSERAEFMGDRDWAGCSSPGQEDKETEQHSLQTCRHKRGIYLKVFLLHICV